MFTHNKTQTDVYPISDGGRCYEIYVCTPLTYARTSKRYPVLYCLDANLGFGSALDSVRLASLSATMLEGTPDTFVASGAPEVLLVGIGYPGDGPEHVIGEAMRRRCEDFTSRTDADGEGLFHQNVMRAMTPGAVFGGASAFLRLLVDRIRPLVEANYRADSAIRILAGGSSGGSFAGFTLVSEPEAFTHYIIASPALYVCGEHVFEIEAARAAAREDLPASVFLSMGSREIDLYAATGIAASTTRFAQVLIARNYPSLNLHTYVFPDESHEAACAYALLRGLKTLFG